MAESKGLKSQRDRFLAFSFASADLFIEVADNGNVDYAMGAAKSLTGINDQELVNQNWLELFTPKDKTQLVSLYKRAQPAQRCGPIHVTMNENLAKGREAILTAIRMPESDKLYVTVGFASDLMSKLAELIRQQQDVSLLDKDAFLQVAQEALGIARSMGQNIDMTLFDIPKHEDVRKRLGEEHWDKFVQAVSDILCIHSIDGQAATVVTEGRYGLIHDMAIDSDEIFEQLQIVARENDPNGEGFKIVTKTVSADLQALSERETS